MLLADCFPESFRDNFAERNIDLGVALLIKIPSFNITYDKYAIYIVNDSIDNDSCGLVIINSEINENVNRNLYLKSQHIEIDVKRHNFLEDDSFVDCTKIHSFSKENIIDYIKSNPDHLCGNVHNDILKAIFDKLSNSRSISIKEKKKYSLL